MTQIVDIYTEAVYENLRPMRANWSPDQPVQLGDFGVLDGEAFQHLGNVSTLGLNIGSSIDQDTDDQKTFTSSDEVSVTFNAAGSTAAGAPVTVKASVNISFGSKDAAYFNAAGCSYSMISDKAALATKIMGLYDADKWEREWAVVTDLVRSKATTVVISGAANASIVLEADGSVPRVDLANASIGLEVKSATNVGYQIIAQKGLTPLIGLSKVQSSFFWMGDDFKPLSTSIMRNPRNARIKQDTPLISTEPRSYLQFSQLL